MKCINFFSLNRNRNTKKGNKVANFHINFIKTFLRSLSLSVSISLFLAFSIKGTLPLTFTTIRTLSITPAISYHSVSVSISISSYPYFSLTLFLVFCHLVCEFVFDKLNSLCLFLYLSLSVSTYLTLSLSPPICIFVFISQAPFQKQFNAAKYNLVLCHFFATGRKEEAKNAF